MKTRDIIVVTLGILLGLALICALIGYWSHLAQEQGQRHGQQISKCLDNVTSGPEATKVDVLLCRDAVYGHR